MATLIIAVVACAVDDACCLAAVLPSALMVGALLACFPI